MLALMGGVIGGLAGLAVRPLFTLREAPSRIR
jgi:hypothetical protein